jgi:hypothetical protein
MQRIFPFPAFATVALALALPAPLVAQDAAETAIILGGTGQVQGRAQRSLGTSIARSMGNAADAIAATSRARPSGTVVRRHAGRSNRGAGKFAIILPGDVDPLEKTDAPSYELANGATIRVSGGMRRPVAASKTPQ